MTQTTSADVRSSLIDALQLDLVGPTSAHLESAEEILPQAPSKWYLTGFLVPYEADIHQRSDETATDELDQISRTSPGDDETTPEAVSSRRVMFPSSIGLSFLVAATTQTIDISVEWGDYTLANQPTTEAQIETSLQALTSFPWQRQPRQASLTLALSNHEKPTQMSLIESEPSGGQISLPLNPQSLNKRVVIPQSDGLELVLSVRPVQSHPNLPVGTRSVSLFLINHRTPAPDTERDKAYIFQASLTVRSLIPFVPRPDLRGQSIDDEDERIADLQYRHDYEYAVGHNVSAIATLNSEGDCHQICTTWLPTADVEKVIPTEIPNVNLEMEAIGNAPDAATIRSRVGAIVTAYSDWIQQQQAKAPTTPPQRAEVSQDLLHRATKLNERIESGLQALDDPDVLEAFKIANRAIALSIRQRWTHGKENALPEDAPFKPKWRPFQLAFLLMNIVGIADPDHHDRAIVDLLFFPTGGGKTEAYLGLAAFTLVLRRLRNPGIGSAGLSVLMRYTLRLLTLDQLGRASTLICALELERQQNVEKLGQWAFEIGLWVGQTATPNKMGKKGDNDDFSARSRTIAYQNNSSSKPCPIPLENCPWCGTKFTINSFILSPNADQPTDLRIVCVNRKKRPDGQFACPFRRDRSLPIVAVDEPIYRRLPCFIIATVDKFANLPWVGETGKLFGRVTHYDRNGFYSSADAHRPGQRLENLPPPDLIIQDELHLISGPLGTMVGLYETAIEALCCRSQNGTSIRPKIVASTATVRRATSQIRALFGRDSVDVFPPPGPDRRDSFFAQTVPITERNGRSYVGVAAQGRSLKVVLLRVYLALLGAAQKAWNTNGGAKNPDNPADPYMTLLGYFNSLRELGGSRRIVEDEVHSQLESYGARRRETETVGLFANRTINYEPLELTSRVNTSQVAEVKSRLEKPFCPKENDVVLATNMISVGLDITRLGLMVVLGQPKTTAEYIQATSRVGRDETRPGLVVTLLNVHRPRDRSHYERFQAWHHTFYRAVEATSVTPFSPRALDRGLAAVTVALARLGCEKMTAPLQAVDIVQHRQELEFVVRAIVDRAVNHDKLTAEAENELRQKLRGRIVDLLDSWKHLAADKGSLQYQQEVGIAPPLLYDPLDLSLEKQPKIAQKFKAQRSLRDVERTVNLWVKNPDGYDVEEES